MEQTYTKQQAVEFFNKAWDMIEKVDRNATENLSMIDYAFKSKYYWSLCGNEVNCVRSDWQVSRVFAEAGLYEASLIYAKLCLQGTLSYNMGGFDLFFAYEANYRVLTLLNKEEESSLMYDKAINSIDLIEKESDRIYCLQELEKISKGLDPKK